MKKDQLTGMTLTVLKRKVKHQSFISGLLTVLVVGMFLVTLVIKPETSTPSKIYRSHFYRC